MRNSAALRLSLLRSLLTRVVPLPLPLDHPQREQLCFWCQEGLLYETQVHRISGYAQGLGIADPTSPYP